LAELVDLLLKFLDGAEVDGVAGTLTVHVEDTEKKKMQIMEKIGMISVKVNSQKNWR
jgi:hypothetical protein